MPLKTGTSSKIVSENVSELIHTGRAKKQAVAIALKKSKKKKEKTMITCKKCGCNVFIVLNGEGHVVVQCSICNWEKSWKIVPAS